MKRQNQLKTKLSFIQRQEADRILADKKQCKTPRTRTRNRLSPKENLSLLLFSSGYEEHGMM